ncbi:MurR/RpiR family transcriptional regulator [Olsenella uli]|uniref:MurR/RpiR family transcriptional regulator n=1 Tax=Olsenella uli TaxID=133926 RepID=UPI00195ECD07|nr:MurR/RpiR family transcriptional regulator [Olsenella uli]MBM6815813.1 MurR/RpiR family transcriptional regulator [Olsenella uli]
MASESLFRRDVSYTEAEHLIMDFVSTRPAEFLVMSIQQVSARLKISDATVSRFARHAGFRDFKELKAAVASATLGPAEKIQASIEGVGSPRAFLAEQRENIGRTAETLDEEAFGRAADALAGASRVLLLGKGAARSFAELLRFRLARFGKEALVLEAGSDVMEGLVRADAGTVLLAFGFERVPAEVEVALAYLRRVSGRSILLTGRRLRGSGADVELVAYRGEPRGYHSMASAVALIDALVVAVASRMGAEALDRLELLKGLKRGNEARLPR